MSLVEMIKNNEAAFKLEPASREHISKAEAELNVVFSKEYVEYLSEFGVATFDGHELTGICNGKRLDVVRITKERRNNMPSIPNNWYVVECLDIDGVAIWQDELGQVFQTSPRQEKIKIANSLAEYIEQ